MDKDKFNFDPHQTPNLQQQQNPMNLNGSQPPQKDIFSHIKRPKYIITKRSIINISVLSIMGIYVGYKTLQRKIERENFCDGVVKQCTLETGFNKSRFIGYYQDCKRELYNSCHKIKPYFGEDGIVGRFNKCIDKEPNCYFCKYTAQHYLENPFEKKIAENDERKKQQLEKLQQ